MDNLVGDANQRGLVRFCIEYIQSYLMSELGCLGKGSSSSQLKLRSKLLGLVAGDKDFH